MCALLSLCGAVCRISIALYLGCWLMEVISGLQVVDLCSLCQCSATPALSPLVMVSRLLSNERC